MQNKIVSDCLPLVSLKRGSSSRSRSSSGSRSSSFKFRSSYPKSSEQPTVIISITANSQCQVNNTGSRLLSMCLCSQSSNSFCFFGHWCCSQIRKIYLCICLPACLFVYALRTIHAVSTHFILLLSCNVLKQEPDPLLSVKEICPHSETSLLFLTGWSDYTRGTPEINETHREY